MSDSMLGAILVEAVYSRDSKIRETASARLSTLVPGGGAADLVAALREAKLWVVERSKALASHLHEVARLFVLDLAELALRSSRQEVRTQAVEILVRFGTTATPVFQNLVQGLSNSDSTLQAAAAFAVGTLRIESGGSVELLTEGLRSPEWRVREAAGWALGSLGVAGAIAATELAALALHDPEQAVRNTAGWALLSVSGRTDNVIEQLHGSFCDPDAGVRGRAIELVRALGPITPKAATNLVELALRDPDRRVQDLAAQVIGSFSAEASQTIQEPLLSALRDSDEQVRATAIKLLHTLKLSTRGTETELFSLALREARPEVREMAAEMFASLGTLAERAVPPILAAALHDPEPRVRETAAYLLDSLGPASLNAVPELVATALKTPEWRNAEPAFQVLKNSPPLASAAYPLFVAALGDEDADVRERAAWALGTLKVSNGISIPALLSALRAQDSYIRQVAEQMLSEMGPADADMVPLLISALEDTEPLVREKAADALGFLGNSGAEAAPRLANLAVKDADERVRESSAFALRRLGRDAAAAVEVLTRLSRTGDTALTSLAAEALKRLAPEALVAAVEKMPAKADPEREEFARLQLIKERDLVVFFLTASLFRDGKVTSLKGAAEFLTSADVGCGTATEIMDRRNYLSEQCSSIGRGLDVLDHLKFSGRTLHRRVDRWNSEFSKVFQRTVELFTKRASSEEDTSDSQSQRKGWNPPFVLTSQGLEAAELVRRYFAQLEKCEERPA